MLTYDLEVLFKNMNLKQHKNTMFILKFLKSEILGNKSEEKTCILKTGLGKDFLETILKI